MKGTVAHNQTYGALDCRIARLEATWRERWERWLRATNAQELSLAGFVEHVLLDDGALDPRGNECVDDNFTWIVDDRDSDAFAQVIFLSGYGEIPAPATLVGFEWFDGTASDLRRLEPIVSRLYRCLRGLAPALAEATVSAQLEQRLRQLTADFERRTNGDNS